MWKKITNSKWLYVVLSILMSIILWSYVMKVANPDQKKSVSDIPVTFTGTDTLSERGLIMTAGGEQKITLNVSAKMDIMSKLTRETIAVSVDVSKITEPGNYHRLVSVKFPSTVLTGSVAFEDVYVDITVSKLESKEVPVRLEFTGNLAEGYQAGEYSVSPSQVSISGQSELVNQVAYAKVVLSQKDLNETYTGDLAFIYVGSDGQELADFNVESNVDTVHVVYPVVKFKEVPLAVDIIPGGGATSENVNVVFRKPNGEEIETLDVTGPEDALDAYTEIHLGEVDLSEVVQSKEYTFTVQIPEGFSNASGINEITATVTIEGLVTREFDVDNIKLINDPAGFTATAVTQSRLILVRGTQEAVDALYQSQIRIVVDVAGGIPAAGDGQYSPGRYTVPAKVYLDGSDEVGVVFDYDIIVNLTESTQEEPT